MSKSLGNFTLLRDILNVYEGKIVRFFMLSSHYRKPIDFSDEELNMAKAAIERIENTLVRTLELEKEFDEDINEDVVLFEQKLEDVEAKFQFAMDEDFNTARAIGVIFEFIKELNKFMDNGFKSKKAGMLLKLSRDFVKNVVEDVLGVKLNLDVKLDEGLTAELMDLILDIRLEAKKDKNYALADKIRDRLGELGVEIKDGRDKSSWTLKK